MRVLSTTVHRLRRATSSEAGFTLTESMVALMIFAVALLALASSVAVAMKDVGFARQRQTANAIANEALEQVRGLPYSRVSVGLDQTDMDTTIANGTETNIVKDTSTNPVTYRFRGETIPYGTVQTTAPTVPHIKTFTYGNSVYTRRVYVTNATGAAAGAFHVTVIVSWANPLRKGVPASVEAQTIVFASPPGATDCISSQTHPFSGPCQAFFYGNGSIDPGWIQTTGPIGTIAYESMYVDLFQGSADMQLEQVSQVQAQLTTAGGRKVVSGVEDAAGEWNTAAAADSDPSSAAPKYELVTVPATAAETMTVSAGSNSLSVTAGSIPGGDAATAAITADASNPCNSQTDGLPCGYMAAATSPAVDEVLSLNGPGNSYLVRVASSNGTRTVFSDRNKPQVAYDGQLRETVVRQTPEIQFGGLPSGMTPPSGWTGYWLRLTGYSVTAQAEAGTQSAAPSYSINGGQVQYWNGSNYRTVNITANGGSVPVPSFTYSAAAGGVTYTVQMTATLNWDASTTSQTFLPGSTTTRVNATATVGAPLTGKITYTVTKSSTTLADLQLTINLGTTTAHGVYQVSPTS